ncbi:MAG: AI-2E family transporter [Eubacteriales bacterium]
MKFNKKYTTVAFYACLVILFAVVCVYLLLSLDKGRFASLSATLRSIISKIFIGAIIAYILDPIVNFFENWVFVRNDSRKKVLEKQKKAKKESSGMSLAELFEESGKEYEQIRKTDFEAKLEKYRQNPTRKIGKHSFKQKKEPVFKPHPFRGLSILCTFLLFIFLLLLLGWVVIPQLGHTIYDLTVRIQSIKLDELLTKIQNNETLSEIYTLLINNGLDLASILKQFQDMILSVLVKAPTYLFTAITSIYQTVYDWIIGLIFAIYFLSSKDLLFSQFRYVMNSFFPDKACYWIKFIIRDVDVKFGKFIEGKIVDSIIIGILSFIIFSIVQIPYAAMIALIVGITNIIPFFGPFIGAIPSALIILISDPSKVILFIILIIVIQQLDGNWIGPYILGDSLELPPVWIMIAIITMGGLFGFFGMFFGVPIFAVFFTLIKELAVISRQKKEKKKLAAENSGEKTTEENDNFHGD